jgi:hypothetical protein
MQNRIQPFIELNAIRQAPMVASDHMSQKVADSLKTLVDEYGTCHGMARRFQPGFASASIDIVLPGVGRFPDVMEHSGCMGCIRSNHAAIGCALSDSLKMPQQ